MRKEPVINLEPVPHSSLVMACRRVLPFLRAIPLVDYNLQLTLASVYLQGVRDGCTVIEKQQIKEKQKEQGNE